MKLRIVEHFCRGKSSFKIQSEGLFRWRDHKKYIGYDCFVTEWYGSKAEALKVLKGMLEDQRGCSSERVVYLEER